MNNNTRQSNIELLRIVAMFLVVAHHYVVNSGINELFDFSKPVSANTLFLQWWGMWGKTAINAFVLITGYFMCSSRLTMRRIFKLYLEVQFYLTVGFFALVLIGYERISIDGIANLLVWPLMGLNRGFTASFMVFYAFIPLYNIIIGRLSCKALFFWTSMLVGIYVIPYTFLGNHQVFNYMGWYIALYFTGAFLRVWGRGWMEKNRICIPLLSFAIGGALFSSWLYGWNVLHKWPNVQLKCIGTVLGVAESCSLMAFIIGVLMFLVFKNLRIPYNRFINGVASTTFGILLAHTFSGGMRRFLWRDVVDAAGHYSRAETAGDSIVVFTIMTVCSIFALCSAVDYLRIILLERPFFERFCTVVNKFRGIIPMDCLRHEGKEKSL